MKTVKTHKDKDQHHEHVQDHDDDQDQDHDREDRGLNYTKLAAVRFAIIS
jgi:hypothetical protein